MTFQLLQITPAVSTQNPQLPDWHKNIYPRHNHKSINQSINQSIIQKYLKSLIEVSKSDVAVTCAGVQLKEHKTR